MFALGIDLGLLGSILPFLANLRCGLYIRNVLLVNSNADHLKVGDFGLSKLIRVQNSHDIYKMTGETGSCMLYILQYFSVIVYLIDIAILFNSFWFFMVYNPDRYMAPEVFKHRKYDKKVDVFSFAMILYEVLSF